MSLTGFTNSVKVLLETKGGKLLQKDMLKYILIINQIEDFKEEEYFHLSYIFSKKDLYPI